MNGETSWVNGLEHIIKMTLLTKAFYRFSAIPIKIPMAIFAEMAKLILKFICNCKGPKIAKTILKKQLPDSHFPISKLTTKLQ